MVSWDSYDGELQVILIRPEGGTEEETWALVTTILDQGGWEVFKQYGKRWWLENRGNRELKEAYGLERELWNQSAEAAFLSVYLRLITYNLIQLYRRQPDNRIAARGLRGLRQEIWHGPEILVIAGEEFGVYHVEEFAALCGNPARMSLRPKARARAP